MKEFEDLKQKMEKEKRKEILKGLFSIMLYSAGFPLGEFVRANKQKANVIGW